MSYTVERLLNIARAQIGYHEKNSDANLDSHTASNDGNKDHTKYARDLHKAGYYQANKCGFAWCDVFVDWCFYQLADQNPEIAQKMEYQTGPYGAGCIFSANYYKQAGKFYTSNPQPGDQIFFGTLGREHHTGIVEAVTSTQIITIEGNSNNQVARRSYLKNDSKIAGYGRPNYDIDAKSSQESQNKSSRFVPRLTKPEAGNPYYNTKSNGGYSDAIVGSPTDAGCNVLSNCVGYAYGRFNEIGGYGSCKYLSPVNAENFIKYKGNLSVGMTPKLGACMVWQKGPTLSGRDGAGHVAIVEKIISDTEIVTSESGWGYSAFWTKTRKKGNGNWGYNTSSGYKFLGFIYNPAVESNTSSKVEIKGIDVSRWQGNIDWNKVKADGIKFAMIRLGYGSADGKSCGLDGYFKQNVTNATKAGIDIGCYFYSYATSVEAVKREAEYVINILKDYKGVFTYPISFDLEDRSQEKLGRTVLTEMAITFMGTLEKAGYYSILYTNPSWIYSFLDDSKLSKFDHWIAHWGVSKPSYNGDLGMWQNSAKGRVTGINGDVDTDIAYRDYSTLIKAKNLNGFTSDSKTPTPSTGASQSSTGLKFKVGDIVNFTGNKQYASSNATKSSSTKPSRAKITSISKSGKHPYHCRAVNTSGTFVSGVYGWVDSSDVSEIPTNSSDKESIKVDSATKFSKNKAGTYVVKANGGLVLRSGASTSKSKIEVMPNGSRVQCYGYYTGSWLYVVSPSGKVGFANSKYLVK